MILKCTTDPAKLMDKIDELVSNQKRFLVAWIRTLSYNLTNRYYIYIYTYMCGTVRSSLDSTWPGSVADEWHDSSLYRTFTCIVSKF